MYRIVLTGGIGTGKTYIAAHFVEMGIPVFYSDDEAKKLYRDADFCRLLREHFGCRVITGNFMVNTQELAKLVFADKEKLMTLNRLVHPRVMQQFEMWGEMQKKPVVMMESALAFEAGLASRFDKIIVADAPLELRIRRILSRNPSWTHEAVLQRIACQMPQEEKCRRADLIIYTGDTYRELHA